MHNVLMQGYYGKGNFGDDVLMVTTYAIVRHALPRASIALMTSDTDSYTQRLLSGVALIKPEEQHRFDLIVHGGGGVFFDFMPHGMFQRIIEMILQIVGFKAYVFLEKILRTLLARPRPSAARRIGLGIGVGTFTPGSPRMRYSLPILAEFDALWLRDKESATHLKRFASVMHTEIIEGSDMAFLSHYWLNAPITERAPSARPRLGIILRDWAGFELNDVVAQLAKDYEITGFIFDAQADAQMQRALAPYTTHVWQPQSMTISDFAAHIAAQDVLLTSRAHGAICGACLGVASVIVDIEPKMGQVHAMLPHATRIVHPAHMQQWSEAIGLARSISQEVIAANVEMNRVASSSALKAMERWWS